MTDLNNQSSLNILMVDDEKAIQKIVTHYFTGKHKVHTCNNGNEALQWLYDGNFPDIIIADYNMPVLDGLQFLKELKTSGMYANIPLIFLSGKNSTETKINCLNEGADDFIIKPFNPAELQARINSILRRNKIAC